MAQPSPERQRVVMRYAIRTLSIDLFYGVLNERQIVLIYSCLICCLFLLLILGFHDLKIELDEVPNQEDEFIDILIFCFLNYGVD